MIRYFQYFAQIHILQALQLSLNDMRALKRMGLSKVDVEEVEELARSVARQIRAQMDLRGRFQGVSQEKVLLELKKHGELSVLGEDVDEDAAVDEVHNQKIDNMESSEDDLVNKESSKSERRRRGVSLSAGLQFGFGGHRRRHKHGALRLNIDKYHHGGRYGEEGHYDDYSHFDQDYHHDNRHSFSKDYHDGDYHNYDDHHHHYDDHRRHQQDYHNYHHY